MNNPGYLWRITKAFIRRDILLAASYRMNLLMQFVEIAVLTVGWYFLAYMFRGADVPYLRPYGGDFFSFFIIGVAFYNINQLAMKGFSDAIRSAQLTGTIESIYQSPINTSGFLIGSLAWPLMYASIRGGFFIFVAAVLFNFRVGSFDPVLLLLLLIISFLAHIGYGLIAACFVVLYKEGNPIAVAFNVMSMFFAGVYIPVDVFPPSIRWIAWFLPTYFSLDAIRKVVLVGAGYDEVMPSIITLLIFIVIMLPIGLILFNESVKIAKKNGNLTGY